MGMRPQSQSGALAIEFVLVLPILAMLLFGIIEFSLILYDKAVITNASREGARAGIISQSPRLTSDQIKNVVNNYCKNYLISFEATNSLITDVSGAGGSFGSDLTVTVTYQYGFLLLPNFLKGLTKQINLSASTVMRME